MTAQFGLKHVLFGIAAERIPPSQFKRFAVKLDRLIAALHDKAKSPDIRNVEFKQIGGTQTHENYQ